MRHQLFPRAPDVFAQVHDNLLDLFREMGDGLESLRLDSAEIRDALRILEKVEPLVTKTAAHFIGGLQREFAFLLPREPNRFQQRDFGRQPMPPQRDQRAEGRMSEEERRNLHRDLDRANREIYKGR